MCYFFWEENIGNKNNKTTKPYYFLLNYPDIFHLLSTTEVVSTHVLFPAASSPEFYFCLY